MNYLPLHQQMKISGPQMAMNEQNPSSQPVERSGSHGGN